MSGEILFTIDTIESGTLLVKLTGYASHEDYLAGRAASEVYELRLINGPEGKKTTITSEQAAAARKAMIEANAAIVNHSISDG